MKRLSRFPSHGPELRALLAACHATPDDDTPRLVLADWLEEHDDPRGELMRLQCQLHAAEPGDPRYDDLFPRHKAWWKRHGKLWQKEVNTLIWDCGPDTRGLPTIGYYDEEWCWLNVEDLDEPKKDRVSAAISVGWAGFSWPFLPYSFAGEWYDDDREMDPDDIDPVAAFRKPPWAESPTPVGVAFPEDAHITADVIRQIAPIRNLRGLALRDTDATQRVLPHVAKLTQLEHLDLGWMRFTDDGLRALAPLTRLRTLISDHGDRGGVTDAGLKTLAKFPELRTLKLAPGRLTAAGFRVIGKLTKLEKLEIMGVTDPFLRHILGLTNLRELDLTGCPVTGPGLERFTRLHKLVLTGTEIDDAGLARLAGLKRLTSLDLDDTEVTGPGLEHLAGLKWLEWLSLSDVPQIGDEHLVHLEGLTNLENLYLDGTGVTKKGVERLSKKLRKTAIVR